MPLTPEQMNEISILRRKAVDGTLTLEECKKAVIWMRESRRSAAEAPAKSSRKKTPANADSMIDELMNM